MDLDEMLARESIRQTIANYNIGGDSRDAALYVAQFADDAILEFAGYTPLPGFRCAGIDAIRAMTAAWVHRPVGLPIEPAAPVIRHNLTTSSITLTGPESAAALTYFMVITEIGPDHAGVYADQLVRRGGRWLFGHRRISLTWRSAESAYPKVLK